MSTDQQLKVLFPQWTG